MSSDSVWWCTFVIPALGRQKEKDHEKVQLGHISKSLFQKNESSLFGFF